MLFPVIAKHAWHKIKKSQIKYNKSEKKKKKIKACSQQLGVCARINVVFKVRVNEM